MSVATHLARGTGILFVLVIAEIKLDEIISPWEPRKLEIKALRCLNVKNR